MKKLYAVKFRKSIFENKGSTHHGAVLNHGHKTKLSFEQLIQLITEKRIGNVESIRHDDETPTNARQLNKTELLELWKAVDRLNKKLTVSRQQAQPD